MQGWMQDLFDLMANENIELLITGECNEVDASLKIHNGKEYQEVASIIGCFDYAQAIEELMTEYKKKKTNKKSAEKVAA